MKFPKPWYRKSRGAWFVTLDGQQVKLGKTEEEALKRYHDLMAKPRAPVVATGSVLAVIDAFLDWCSKHRAPDTYEWYRSRLEQFARTYPTLLVGELRPFHVQQWIDSMHVESGTKRNYCRAIKRCVKWAKQQGYIDANPIEDMEQPKGGKRETVVSDAQYKELLSYAHDPGFRELLNVTWEIGCRPQESLRVEARHVDLQNQRWVFPESEAKTDIPRVVYLTDEALAICKRLMRRYPGGPLFRNSRSNPWTPDSVSCAFERIQIRMGRQILDARIKKKPKDKRRKYIAVDDSEAREFMKTLDPFKRNGERKRHAELLGEARKKLTRREALRLGPRYCLYDLRHTWMNRLLTRGVDALTVAFLAGHSDPSTLAKVYAHLSQNPSYLLDQAKKAAG